MDITKETLKKEFKDDLMPEFKEAIFASDEFKKMLEVQDKKEVLPAEKVREPAKFSRSAEFIRALKRKNFDKIKEIQKETFADYKYDMGIEEKTLTTYLTESDDAQGGFLCPIEWYREFFMIPQTGFGIARRDCNVVPMTTYSMNLHYLTVMPATHWINAGVDLAYRKKHVTKPKVGRKSLTPVVQDAVIVWEEELIADANIALVSFTTARVREAFLRGEDNALFNGNGGLGITGILNDASCQVIPMDPGHINFADINFDDLINLIDALGTIGAEGGAKFYFHYNILSHLGRVKDLQDNYVWDSPRGNIPGTIWGYPYVTSPVMPSNAASAPSTKFVIFGNLKEAVALGDRQTLIIKLLTEAVIDDISLPQYNLNALKFWERLDIEVILGDAIAILETKDV